MILTKLISVIVGVALSDSIRRLFARTRSSLVSSQKEGPLGVWEATFLFGPEERRFTEVIRISSSFGVVYGSIIDDEVNSEHLKETIRRSGSSGIPRVKGRIDQNRHFTGEWLHPVRHSHYHGAFHLLLDTGGESMSGMWLGYSEVENAIQTGQWHWKRRINSRK